MMNSMVLEREMEVLEFESERMKKVEGYERIRREFMAHLEFTAINSSVVAVNPF